MVDCFHCCLFLHVEKLYVDNPFNILSMLFSPICPNVLKHVASNLEKNNKVQTIHILSLYCISKNTDQKVLQIVESFNSVPT